MESSLITPLRSVEVANLEGYLSAVARVLQGVNYSTEFEVTAFNISGDHLPINDVMLTAYPKSNPEQAKIERCVFAAMATEVSECFAYPAAFAYCADGFLVRELSNGLWEQLLCFTDFDDVTIYNYKSGQGLGTCAIIWGFAFLIYNPVKKNCIVIHGYASD